MGFATNLNSILLVLFGFGFLRVWVGLVAFSLCSSCVDAGVFDPCYFLDEGLVGVFRAKRVDLDLGSKDFLTIAAPFLFIYSLTIITN